MSRIFAIAQNTYRETIRNKLLANMVAFAAVLLGLAYLAGSWSLGEPHKIVTDLGLALVVLMGVATAVMAGTLLVWTEVELHTILAVLAKPVARWEFILGKTLGAAAAVMLLYLMMAGILAGLVVVMGQAVNIQFTAALAMGAMEILIVISLAILFSSFTSPAVATMSTLMLFIAGRLSRDLKLFLDNNPDIGAKPLLEAIYSLIPHLSGFNLRAAAVHALPLDGERVIWLIIYGAAYFAAAQFAAMLALSRRDIN